MPNASRRTAALAALLLATPLLAVAHAAAQNDPNAEAQGYQALGYPAPDPGSDNQADPPARVARVSILLGNVSVEPASISQFNAAEANYPMTTGDRIYADAGANAELQTGQIALRLGQQTDLTVTAMTDALAQFGLAEGSVHLRTFGLDAGSTVELDTVNVALTVLQPGDVRVDVDPGSGVTVVTVLSGEVQIDGNGLQQVAGPGQRLSLSGSNPVYAQPVSGARPDGLDRFSADRDQLFESALAGENQYLNSDTIGAEDLAANGSWDSDPDQGPVWYPTTVAADWQPYVYGHWRWIAPWGWTWVENEPWGFAPFHYGRWAVLHGRWGWIPGPAFVRPVYSPALVVFVGAPGSGISAWFPLGPGEPYTPWYHASALYVNRVNVTNLYARNTAQVRSIYNQRSASVYAGASFQGRGYVNRSIATVAVPQAAFAAGRPVAQAEVHVSGQQLLSAPILAHPVVTPERSLVATEPARALPPVQARPVLANHVDMRVSAGIRLAAPAQPQPVQSRQQPVQQQPPAQQQPVQGYAPVSRAPITPARMQGNVNANPPAAEPPARGAAPAADPAQRQLFNRAVPPPPRPSFEQQQQAIQTTDPGRPLSPQQLNNLRQNQPVGQPQQRETPHPAPVAPVRSTPAPRSAPPPPPADRKRL